MLQLPQTKTGKANWTFMMQARIESSPAVADTRVFFGSSDGRAYAVDTTTGKEVFKFEAGTRIANLKDQLHESKIPERVGPSNFQETIRARDSGQRLTRNAASLQATQ